MPRDYSDAQFSDVKAPLEFGHSHGLARQAIPFTLFGVALGLLMQTSLDGRAIKGQTLLLGAAFVVGALAFLAVAIWRRTLPNVASIVIGPSGVLVRDISEKPIPWRDIKAIGFAKVSGSKDLRSTKVVKLNVSKAFYKRYSGGRWLASVIADDGEPSAIYLSYYHALPVEKVHDALQRRWQYYAASAGSTAAPEPDRFERANDPARDYDRAPAYAAPQRTSAIQSRGSASSASAGVLSGMLKEQTLGERVGSLVALAAIGALLSNMLGLWSTDTQLRGRATQAEWRARNAIYDAEQKAWDEDRRKSDAKWDAIKKCMNDMGSIGEDPNCMSKIK